MKMKTVLTTLIFIFLVIILASAQSPPEHLKIMIVPYVGSLQHPLTSTDSSDLYRTATHYMSALLQSRGYEVVDHQEWLNILRQSVQMARRDASTQRIINAPCDIFIYIELHVKEFENGEKQLNALFFSNDKFSGERYATSPLISSGKRYWSNFMMPLVRDIFSEKENSPAISFANQLDEKLKSVIINGRSVQLSITSEDNSSILLDNTGEDNESVFIAVSSWLKNQPRISRLICIGKNDNLLVFSFKVPVANFSLIDFIAQLENTIKAVSTNSKMYKVSSEIFGTQIIINLS